CDEGETCSLTCNILVPTDDNPGGELFNVGACNGDFEVDNDDTRKVKIYINMNGDHETIEEYYDFDDGERSNGSSNDDDLDEFEFYYVEDES
ncbi:MAG TPA: hypothetical protein P5060_01565, partial [Candidatus Absconditabacterales bacterium]|nr:hypothetical protein [Candidatus Absconditabacterales bacterium]